MSRDPRLKVTSWIAHFMKTVMRLWNSTMYARWMKAYTIHPGRPERCTPKTSAAASRPVTAMFPFSFFLYQSS
jgi:hypothetical protein